MATAKLPNGPILLITDLSARCDRAMDRAVKLAQSHAVGLIALHVMDTPWLSKLAQPTWRNTQQNHLESAQKGLASDLAHVDIDVTVIVETGNPVDVIERVALDNGCCLIVSGTARDETLGRIVLGNTVERLARRGAIALLVVRNRPFDDYHRIVVATDFSDGAAQALLAARELGGQTNVTLYHAFDEVAGIYQLDAPAIEEQIAALQKRSLTFLTETTGQAAPNGVTVVVAHGTPHQTLPDYCDQHQIELVVLGTRGATGVVRAAMGSVAEKLLANLPCDVMLVPKAD